MHSFVVTVLAIAASGAFASPSLQTRNIVDEISDAYDFVIVGGGLAGLVLGARLSEDSKYSVLVLEAGGDGEGYLDQINTPGLTYYETLWPTPLNWDFITAPQPNANNIAMEWPRGKVLGGSSAINGLYITRPGEIEVNAWKDMLGDMEGAENWSWDSLFAAMKKSETFTPPSAAIAKEGDITWDTSSHGTDGPIHMTWPGYTFPMVGDWSTSAQNAGVADSKNTYGGENWGAYVTMSCINPANWTRSYSRSGYLDPLPPRSNYDVLPNAYVTRLLFDPSSPAGNKSANAVQYTLDDGATMLTVKVNKEVILAGGSIGSPTVLLYSGVGPQDVLSAAGVDLVVELPGVGEHLQDHLSAGTTWNTSQQTGGDIFAAGGAEATDPVFLSYVNDAVAYVNSSVLFGTGVAAMQNSILSSISQFAPTEETVAAGYHAICSTTANTIFTSPLGQIELLIGNTVGTNNIQLGASLQHPLSQGRIYITSNNPMDYPIIDPAYLTNPVDAEILVAGLKLSRLIAQTEPLSSIMTENDPGPSVQTDEEWTAWMRDNVFTEYHPCSTCAMLPLEQGGVVDANLRVYGLANVRVADASVPPIEFSSHLMSSTYGIAEQASTIILAFYDGEKTTVPDSQAAHKSGSEGGSGVGSGKKHNAASANSGASLLHVISTFFAVAVCMFWFPL